MPFKESTDKHAIKLISVSIKKYIADKKKQIVGEVTEVTFKGKNV